MYYYNHNDKDDPSNKINFDANQLFGQSFEDLNNMNDNNNPFLNFDSNSHSLPSQPFDLQQNDNTSPSPSSLGMGQQQDFLLSQYGDYTGSGGSFHFFDNNNHQDNSNIDPSIFLDDSQQQAILLSDPSFLRQQQLLQEQQQKANKMMSEQQHNQQSIPIRSNLSAMFSSDNNNTNTFSKTNNKESSLSPQIEPINLITSQQQKKDIFNSQNNRRSINNGGKSTKPIPISSSLPSTSSTSSGGIDHQRRFNELQARFRINYAKKPTKQQQQQQQQQQSEASLGSSYNSEQPHPLSSSFTDGTTVNTTGGNRRKSSLDPTSNKPLLRVNSSKIKVVGGGSLSSNSKSPTTMNSNNGGMSIPVNTTSLNNNSNNTIASSPSASSFPSRTMPIQIQRVHRANAFQPFDLEQRQKRLDDQLIKVDFNDITVSELKEMLRQRGKPATGKKAILLQRLQEEKDMIIHARANGIPISNRYVIQQQQQQQQQQPQGSSPVMQSPIMDHAASLPDTMYLSSSPSNNSSVNGLNRSIADMHIGSPPITSQQSRRFSPYATSPRTTTTISSPPSNSTPSFYSSSVPTGSLDMMMMHQHQQQQQQQQQQNQTQHLQLPKQDEPRVMMRGFNFGKKSYAPFASSALATPDRDDDHNPFDDEDKKDTTDNNNKSTTDNSDSPNDMEWTDPTLDFMLQQHGLNSEYNDKTAEELLSFLSSQGLYPHNEFTTVFNNNDGMGMGMVDDNSHNNFQNLTGGGPDLSSVMFDGYSEHGGSSSVNGSNNNNNSHNY